MRKRARVGFGLLVAFTIVSIVLFGGTSTHAKLAQGPSFPSQSLRPGPSVVPPPFEGVAHLPGVDLWYKDTGGRGEPVFLLHANTGTSASWVNQYGPFSEEGYRVIAFDRRGWGRSFANPATGLQPGTETEDLNNLANYLGIARFHVVGVAGGGFVAMDYAAWHPEKLFSLVVTASTGSITDTEIRSFSTRIAFPTVTPAIPVWYMEVAPSYRGGNPAGLAAWIAINATARQPGAPSQPLLTPNTFAKLETIPVPTMVMPGDADLIAPPALMQVWAPHIENCQWTLEEDAGHSVAWEHPEIFNSKVLLFLKHYPNHPLKKGMKHGWKACSELAP